MILMLLSLAINTIKYKQLIDPIYYLLTVEMPDKLFSSPKSIPSPRVE